MRCVQYERFGDESVLQVREVPAPLPAAGQVQVRVAFASLNPVDFKLRSGLLRFIGKPARPAITGKDFAGTVSALAMEVAGLRPGQRVFGSVNAMGGAGSCAEFVALDAGLVAPTPEGVSDEVAACLPVASGTAYQALVTQARLRAGQSVLVTGASGGVGSSAVQIARSIGARVTGVCGTSNLEYVRSIGADEVVDYRRADWRAPGRVYDVIFDAAGASSFGAARPHLAPAGWYINTYPPPSLMAAAPFVRLFSRQHAVPFMLKTTAAQLAELARLAQSGVLRPRIARTVALEEVAAAQRDMQEGRVSGKVCVRLAA
ncbi:MAG TPA: NAD(P)-dependent alcohol dehydrogenase [Burkholderiales bacterium]|nr:NAD(P)-dependent alcohol dehydrogenase [Burkholderiales bacterium]